MKPASQKLLLAGLGGALLAAFVFFDLGRFLSLDYAKSQLADILAFHAENEGASIALYFTSYVLLTAVSFPGAGVLTLLGGAIYGVVLGTILVSFASTIGATLAFLVARFVLNDFVQRKFGERLRAINQGIARDGDFYLFTLRCVPIIPFVVVNLVMGLTPIRTWRYFIVSQIGMLPSTILYVNAGLQLGQINSASDIVSPGLLTSFALLAIFPLLSRKIIQSIKQRLQKNKPLPTNSPDETLRG